MKVLILTFYYPPDLSAGSFRAAALAEALVRTGAKDLEIDVLTTLPHRYASYRSVAERGTAPSGSSGSVTVTRLPVGQHCSGLVDQSVVFSGFAARALRAVRGRRYDTVVATSSRLLTGFLGAMIARRTGASLYLDIRDLFVDNMREMFGIRPDVRLLAPALSWIERETVRCAARINLVSEGFLDYYRRRFPAREYRLFSNGIDAEFLNFDFLKPALPGPMRIVYAGNIGLGQGMESIVPEAARRLGGDYELRIIGDGGRRVALERRLAAAGVRNVTLVQPMDRAALKQEYRNADYLFLHLNGYSALERVLPSKLFEYAATGKPILAGVRGYARRFISEEVSNAVVFDPGDVEGMVGAVRSLAPSHCDRHPFKVRFSRETLMDRMAWDIIESVSAEGRAAGGVAGVSAIAAAREP
jgi:glycosyltransferase involved in cell wall biosynthesis